MKKQTEFQAKQYQIVKNIISQDVAKLATQALILSEANYMVKNSLKVGSDGQVDGSQCFYSHPVTEALMLLLLPKMEKVVKEKLLPTYSYARVYRNGSVLKKHTDRASCEISVSIQLGAVGVTNKGGWAITMGKEQLFLADGDGVVYNGIKVPHERDELFCESNGFQVQCFCHYVKANGRFSRFAYDKRIGPGIIKE